MSSEPRYFLAPHAYLCKTDYHWILLDLNRDKYLAVHKRNFESVGPQLHGWARFTCQHAGAVLHSSTAATLADDLLREGLLTTDGAIGKTAEPLHIEPPTSTLAAEFPAKRDLLPLIYAFAFLVAAARADRLLRRSHISHVVSVVRARKRKYERTHEGFNHPVASRLVAVFSSLRPIYPRDYLCLFDSLALIEFLATYRLFPSWIFGVTSDPFEAHCWLQEDHIVLNDSVANVSVYSPVMVV